MKAGRTLKSTGLSQGRCCSSLRSKLMSPMLTASSQQRRALGEILEQEWYPMNLLRFGCRGPLCSSSSLTYVCEVSTKTTHILASKEIAKRLSLSLRLWRILPGEQDRNKQLPVSVSLTTIVGWCDRDNRNVSPLARNPDVSDYERWWKIVNDLVPMTSWLDSCRRPTSLMGLKDNQAPEVTIYGVSLLRNKL